MQKGGFFNSTDHDRRYSALDFNQLIDTIKSDGIDQYGDKLEVIAGEGLNVIVKSGKAFYNQHWLFNDANLTLELEQASPTQDRIDAIIIEVNETDRTMLIKSVTGEPSDTPVAPALVNTTNIHQYYLAWVEVDTGSLVVGTITDKRTEWADIESVRQDENELTTSNLVTSLASVEGTNVASKNYDVGDYLTMNGILYKVAVAITQGSSLVVGTNITPTDTGTELVGAINSAKASAINLAPIEQTNIASQTYAVGRYLVYNGLLYKVTSAIAQGATLQVGVNIEQTKVGTELTRIDNKALALGNMLTSNTIAISTTVQKIYTATTKCRVFIRVSSAITDVGINLNANANSTLNNNMVYFKMSANVGVLMNINSDNDLPSVITHNLIALSSNVFSIDLNAGEYLSIKSGTDYQHSNHSYKVYELV